MKTLNLSLVALAVTLSLGMTATSIQADIVATNSGSYTDGANFDTGVAPVPNEAVIIDGFDLTTGGSSFAIGNAINTGGGTGSLTVDNGSFTGGEAQLAFLRNNATPSTASLNIGSAGTVTLNQVWFGAATGQPAANQNDVSINFTGAGGSLSVVDGFGSEGGGTFRLTSNNVTAFSVVNFEELFNLGFLTNNGESGLTGAIFSENFALSQVGDDANDTITAIAVAVPEPSSLALLGLVSLVVVGRRRR